MLNTEILHNHTFGRAHYVELPKRIHTKFISQFLDILLNFYKFWKFDLFLGIFLNQKQFKTAAQYRA
jgi:hypothetical protein